MKLFYTKYLLFLYMTNSCFEPQIMFDHEIKSYTCSPLHTAVKTNNIPELKKLLVQPWNVNYQDSDNQTPLALAVGQKKHHIMEILLHSGAQPNNFTLLELATKNNDCTALQLLINYGADVNIHGENKYLPLRASREIETTELLLRAGRRVNHTNDEGVTPLFDQFNYAWYYKQFLKQCVLNLYYGADPNQRGMERRSNHEEHIIKLTHRVMRGIPFVAAVALVLWGAGKTCSDSNDLKKWADKKYLRYIMNDDMDEPRMKLLQDLLSYPQMLGAESKKDLDQNLLQKLDIADSSIEKICASSKVVRREFLEIVRDRMGIRPAPEIGSSHTSQKTTNLYSALRMKQIGLRPSLAHRRSVNLSQSAI